MMVISDWMFASFIFVTFMAGYYSSAIANMKLIKWKLGPMRYETLMQWIAERKDIEA